MKAVCASCVHDFSKRGRREQVGTSSATAPIPGAADVGPAADVVSRTQASVHSPSRLLFLLVAFASCLCGCGSASTALGPLSSPGDPKMPPSARLAVASAASCLVLTDGRVACWGNNLTGQLGDGTRVSHPRPVLVKDLAGARAVDVSGNHACALLVDGRVACWGSNSAGQIGDGTFNGPQHCGRFACSTRAVAVDGVVGATAIAVGGDMSCALTSGGVVCWGVVPDPEGGRLIASPTPVPIALDNPKAITAGGEGAACALVARGEVQCWGYNTYGEWGNGATDGPRICVNGPCSAAPMRVRGIKDATTIVAGSYDTCAIVSGGAVECWGSNDDGELGLGNAIGPQRCGTKTAWNECSTVPVRVHAIRRATAVGAGDAACAVILGGQVKCWGENDSGELGIGTTHGPDTCPYGRRCSLTPVAVRRLRHVTALGDDGDQLCALLTGDTVDCWGVGGGVSAGDTDNWGALPVPVPIPGIVQASRR